MTSMLYGAAAKLFIASSQLIIRSSQALLVMALFLSVAYYCGWIHRFIIYIIETEASKIINRTPITVGSIEFDLLRGHAWISNVIIHAPRREQWQWESPALARVGRAHVESNVLAIVLRFWCMGEEIPLDIHSVQLSDVQVFVERKQELFNFYLLDPHVQAPDPEPDQLGHDASELEASRNASRQRGGRDAAGSDDLSVAEGSHSVNSNHSSMASLDEQEKAQKLVDGMLRALGRAAKKGTIQDALMESRLSITSHLKALQKSSKKSEVMQEGVKIVQHVSKHFVEKERQLHQVVQPSRTKKDKAKEKIVYGRVGRIILQDARIFTRDNVYHFEETSKRKQGGAVEVDDQSAPSSTTLTPWGKPIYLKQVILRAAELSPPLSCKDVNNTAFPAVYQPIDKILDIVQIRLLTEIAKSNTGRVFQNALGEMLDYWIEKSKQDVATANEVN